MQRVPPFSYSLFVVRYKTGRDYRVPLLSFFRHCATLFRTFFWSPKGPPFKFVDILLQIEVSKSPKGLPFQVFRHNETGSKFLLFDFCFFLEYIFLMSRKGPPSIFKIFCNIIDIKQSQRVLYFRFFGTMRLFKVVSFCLKLGFPIIFFTNNRSKNYPKLGRNVLSKALYPNF